MRFEEIETGKLYKKKDYANVYTKREGLLYHVGTVHGNEFELKMYFVEYTPEFIRNMEFEEIKLVLKG